MRFEALRIPVLLVITAIGAAVGAGVAWGNTSTEVRRQATEIEALKKFRDELILRVQAIEIDSRYTRQSLERLERHFGTNNERR